MKKKLYIRRFIKAAKDTTVYQTHSETRMTSTPNLLHLPQKEEALHSANTF